MTEDKRKTQLLELFSTMSGKTKIVEPMKNIHGTLRDSDAIEREVALVMREIIEQGIFKTSLKPIQTGKTGHFVLRREKRYGDRPRARR